ncbi:hypothetical protein RJT34_19872 [Clitoria ternatea]|uniref:Uncharacterized protein n=1 Tax=Clitoria ternatea TaxID=43366 RepID=A0AAN9IRW2_CLITE
MDANTALIDDSFLTNDYALYIAAGRAGCLKFLQANLCCTLCLVCHPCVPRTSSMLSHERLLFYFFGGTWILCGYGVLLIAAGRVGCLKFCRPIDCAVHFVLFVILMFLGQGSPLI